MKSILLPILLLVIGYLSGRLHLLDFVIFFELETVQQQMPNIVLIVLLFVIIFLCCIVIPIHFIVQYLMDQQTTPSSNK